MKETAEHNNRFYTNEKGEIKTENEQLKEWLLIANKENERLKEENTILKQTMSNNSLLINENALLKSIIKEVREYIENNWISQKDADIYRFDSEELDIGIGDIAILYDILDKENNNEDN